MINKKQKNKLIGLGGLVVISIIVSLSTFNKKQEVEKVEQKPSQTEFNQSIVSTPDTIIEADEKPNDGSEEKSVIWIKNITFLADKNQTVSTILKLKNKLNTELKTLNKDIFEVNLKEETYKETEDGFSIEANADKLEGNILIEYKELEFIFTIITK